MQIDVEVVEARRNTHGIYSVPYGCATITRLCITPESSARPQPSYIPLALVEDYNEACRIRDLSPKAAATLARRCIQGMIRDFAGVKGRTLYDEITALKMMVEKDEAPRGVSIESVEAIDHIRSIGNIGAHMEKDIDLIIPVEPEEAQVLIELIESLFEEWYIERYRRQQRFAAINNIASEKAALKLLPTSQSRE
ncbi:DUF4145 domain-containing protein [Rubellimicrobium aerolatum]|uniref:DUF4145 domain-containing protein n=1 Tax=Rubellimicrobium aerolatum TaxID=490979 RepID=A0ABW0SB55_9RHOB|nr:DUF4145 domain-containing protein [Rubellimicrobium aerolatum]